MKLEYLASGSQDCPLIRLYQFTAAEATELFAVIRRLADGSCRVVELHRLPWVESINGCHLTFVVKSWDQSTLLKAAPGDFECGFRMSRWDDVAALVERFVCGCGGYQWLADSPGEAKLLLSVNGQW